MENTNTRVFQYRFLPDEIREFFLDSGWDDVEAIEKTHGLSGAAEELDRIQQEVIFGYEPTDKIVNLIKARLGLDDKLAKTIALDLIEKRLLPIDSYLGSTAYRTFAHLGGNATVVNIKRIDASGGTVADTRRKVQEHIKEASGKEVPSEPVKVGTVGVELTEEVEGEEVVQSKDTIVSPPAAPKEELPAPIKKAIETVKAYDEVQDKVDEPVKGEKNIDTGVVNADLDPEHELAPPPPAIIEEKPKKKRRRRRKKKAAEPKPDVAIDGADAPVSIDGLFKGGDSNVPNKPKAPKPVEAPKVEEKKAEAPKPVEKPKEEKVVKVKPKKDVKKIFPEAEEEAEVAQMMKKLSDAGERAPKGLEHDKIDEVRRKLSLTFPSGELEKRFRVLVGSRLSGVRSADAFASMLSAEIAKGGLAFDEHTKTRVVEEVEQHVSGKHTEAHKKQSDARAAHVENSKAKYGKIEEVVVKPKAAKVIEPTPKSAPKKAARLSETSVKAEITPEGKRPIQDIRYERKLVGPIEELRRMNLADFRRMPGDVDDAIDAIREDLGGLAKQDPGLRIRAIEAWRASPLVQLYQKLVAIALQEGLSFEDVLKDEAKNPKGMKLEEIHAIRNFNAHLRY